MKITAVKTTPLAVPFKQTHVTWTGNYPAKSTLLIEIETDEGITGLGEAPGIPLPEMVALNVREFEELLIGRDPFLINDFHQKALRAQPKAGLVAMTWSRYQDLANNALGGIDIALWDIVGKATGQPLHRLLGGAVRDRIDMYAWIHRKPLEQMIADALEFQKQGFRVFYMKIGLGSQRDFDELTALRMALGPDAIIRGDANGAWTPTEAIRELKRLEPIGLDWIEQPVIEDDLEGMERVARVATTPICIDQGVNTSHLAFEVIRRRLCDVLCSDLHRTGSILSFREVASMAALANISICRHAGPEFGISAIAHLHLVATIPNLSLGNQTYATTIADDIVEQSGTDFVDGTLPVPIGPGIGVTLDYDKVGRYAEAYRKMRR
jgi:L-alanine-DL-glutamate epimerase-like enolase superfamily enzyme